MTRALQVLRHAAAKPIGWMLPATGRHRLQPVLLRDDLVPAPDGPVPHVVLDEDELHRLLEEGAAEVLECAPCPTCDRITAHAKQNNGFRRCWKCGTETLEGGAE